MHISNETVALLCLVMATFGPPALAAPMFISAVSRWNTHKPTAYWELGLSVLLTLIWVPLVASIPKIAASMLGI